MPFAGCPPPPISEPRPLKRGGVLHLSRPTSSAGLPPPLPSPASLPSLLLKPSKRVAINTLGASKSCPAHTSGVLDMPEERMAAASSSPPLTPRSGQVPALFPSCLSQNLDSVLSLPTTRQEKPTTPTPSPTPVARRCSPTDARGQFHPDPAGSRSDPSTSLWELQLHGRLGWLAFEAARERDAKAHLHPSPVRSSPGRCNSPCEDRCSHLPGDPIHGTPASSPSALTHVTKITVL